MDIKVILDRIVNDVNGLDLPSCHLSLSDRFGSPVIKSSGVFYSIVFKLLLDAHFSFYIDDDMVLVIAKLHEDC